MSCRNIVEAGREPMDLARLIGHRVKTSKREYRFQILNTYFYGTAKKLVWIILTVNQQMKGKRAKMQA